METLSSRTKRIVLPAVLSLICFLHVVSTNSSVDTVSLLDSPQRSLGEDLMDFFKTLVRKRRQLPRRQDLDKMGFTEIERQAMLAVHNAHRSTVNPSAANMIEVRWDSDIESFAQNWSANCAFQHRGNRNLGPWINMGENIYFTSGGRYSEKQAVDWWWNEYRFYTFENKTCQSGEQCGHYITAAWAKTEYIGCGITRCDDLQGVGIPAYLIVCNYSGRFLSNARPFQEGTSCSNCPSGYPRCRYNLCVTDAMLTGCEGYNGTTVYISATRANSVSDPMNCPGFAVDPIITMPPEVTTDSTTSNIQTTADAVDPIITTHPDGTEESTNSNSQRTTDAVDVTITTPPKDNTTDADDGSCRLIVNSISTLVLCLSSCFLTCLIL